MPRFIVLIPEILFLYFNKIQHDVTEYTKLHFVDYKDVSVGTIL